METQIRNVLFKKLGSSDVISISYEPNAQFKIGRANDNDIRVDQSEDAVSRYHAILNVDGTQFTIADNNSTNGLFVNGNKVPEKELMPGDVVRLGKNGPQFEFDLDPRPSSMAAKTRVIDISGETREISTFDNHEEEDIIAGIDEAIEQASQKDGVGKETVERMITAGQSKTKKTNWLLIGLSLAVLAVAGYMMFKPKAQPNNPGPINHHDEPYMTPKDIAEKYGKSVVMIRNAWKLVYTPTGEDIYHMYDKDPVSGLIRAVYYRTPTGIEPLCVRGKPNGYSKLMAGSGQGTGFVANPEGYIVTNRHVANTWMDVYAFSPDAFPGLLIEQQPDNTWGYREDYYVTAVDLQNFVPSKMSSLEHALIDDDKSITGSLFYTDVIFPGSNNPISAQVTRVSDKHDVAILKINTSGRLISSQLMDNAIRQGEEVSVMGYPALSPGEYKAIDSKTMSLPTRKYETIASPSIFNGIISKKIGQAKDISKVFTMGGDTYQLNINQSGAGNSGGPVYNKDGKVIGIYTYGMSAPGFGSLSFAVPIKYAVELMNVF